MDPLSALEIVSFAIEVSKGIWKLYECVRDADDVLKGLRQELKGFESLLNLIDPILRSPNIDFVVTNEIQSMVCNTQDAVKALEAKLAEIKSPEKSKASHSFKLADQAWRIKYPFKKSVLWDLRERVGELYEQLFKATVLANNNIGLRAMQEHRNMLSDQINSVHQDLLLLKDDKEREAILDWLTATDPSLNQNEASMKREADTGNWVFENAQFDDWRNGSGSVLWLHGKPGCGKTILCSNVVQYLESHTSTIPGTYYSYYYFSFQDKDKQNYSNCVLSVVAQLCKHIPVPAELRSLYKRSFPAKPHASELRAILKKILATHVKKLFLIIDAVDECPETNDNRSEVLNWLRDLQQTSLTDIHTMIFSRDLPDIRETLFEELQARSIAVADAQVQEDIQVHIQSEIERHSSLRKMLKDPELRFTVTDTLAQKANGMFRYVVCQLDKLKRERLGRPKDIKRILDSLPESLDETYERILSDIPLESRDTAITALRWLAFAERPLFLYEIAEACTIIPDGDKIVDPESRFPKEMLFNLLTTLILRDDLLAEDFRVRLAHFSVKEFLISKRISQSKNEVVLPFALEQNLSQAMLARNCLLYIQHCAKSIEGGNGKAMDNFPFSEYSMLFWVTHYRQTSSEDTEWLFYHMVSSENQFVQLLRAYRPDNDYLSPKPLSVPTGTPLYYAAWLGLEHCVQKLLSNGADVNAEGGYYHTPLQAAAFRGHESIFDLLLEAGADPHKVGGSGISALSAAAFSGLESQVADLLRQGVSVHQGGETPLLNATRTCRPSIVKMLLEAGADADVEHSFWGTPISMAACRGSTDLCALLLSNGARIEHEVTQNTSASYRPVLKAVAGSDGSQRLEMIRWLIARGADVNATCVRGRTALQDAVLMNRADVVVELLEAGADPNAGKPPSSLEEAISGGIHYIAAKLQDYGAILVGRDEEKKIYGGQRSLVAELVKSGELYNVLGEDGMMKESAKAAFPCHRSLLEASSQLS